MHILIAVLRFAAIGALIAGFIYLQYRYTRWRWEQRNKDMQSGIQTLFDGRK